MSLAVVAPIRSRPLLQSHQDIADFEQDLLSEFVLARAAAGLADESISGDVAALMEVRGWLGRPLWELVPSDLDRFFGQDQRRLAMLTKVRKAQSVATFFEFLELRHQADIHAATGVLVQCPVDEINRPRGNTNMRVRIPPPATDIDRLFAGWRDDLHSTRKYAPAVRNYTACRLASLIGPRVSELCLLDVTDIRWDLGTFGKVLLRGKGRRGQKKERLVPLINGSRELLEWWVQGPRWDFDDRLDQVGSPLFPSERRDSSGRSMRVSTSAIRGAMAETVERHLPNWVGRATPHALRHFAASDLYAQGMNVVAIQEMLGHSWINTTMIYVHVNKTHIEDAWLSAGQRLASRFTG
jgi:site-specific recombinase XerD